MAGQRFPNTLVTAGSKVASFPVGRDMVEKRTEKDVKNEATYSRTTRGVNNARRWASSGTRQFFYALPIQ